MSENIKQNYFLWDDFSDSNTSISSMIGETGWIISAVGSPLISNISLAGRIGIKQCSTSSKTNDEINVIKASTFDLALSGWYLGLAARFTVLTSVRRRLGFRATGLGQAIAMFEKLETDTNWFSVTADTVGQTRKDTGVADDGNFHNFELFKINGDWQFHIDGVLKTTHVSGENLPNGISAPVMILTTTNNAIKVMDIDWVTIGVSGLSR